MERTRSRFWNRVEIRNDTDCWPWKLSTGSHGYGQIGWWENGKSKMTVAHRMAYELSYGEIPSDMTVDHICFNKICCNPAHLRLLTNKENASYNNKPKWRKTMLERYGTLDSWKAAGKI